eukprot:3891353-Pyramimonas_sp.AAC.1
MRPTLENPWFENPLYEVVVFDENDTSGRALLTSWEEMRHSLENPFYENTFRIGANQLCKKVTRMIPKPLSISPDGSQKQLQLLKAVSLLGVFESSAGQQGDAPSMILT